MTAHDNLSDVQFTARTVRGKTRISARQDGVEAGFAKVSAGALGSPSLDVLHVRPDARGQGLGHQLVERVTQQFGKDKSIQVEALPFKKRQQDPAGPSRESLRGFYAKHGFQSEGDSDSMIRHPA